MGLNLFTNNAVGQLASSIADTDLSLTLGSGEGALFPNPAGGQYFYATIYDDANNMEVVKCTARSTNTLTIVRAQEGTTALAFDAGDNVELRVVASSLSNFGQTDSENTWTQNQTFSGDVAAATATVSGNATVGGTLGVSGVATFTSQPLFGANPLTALPSGTKMLFGQAAAPTGWTGINTYNDYALRLVNTSGGTGGNVGGSTAFTSVLTSRTIAEANLPSHTHTFSATTSSNGAHTHASMAAPKTSNVQGGGNRTVINGMSETSYDGSPTDQWTTSSDGAHTHTISGTSGATGSGTAMDFAVAYQNVIMASKD